MWAYAVAVVVTSGALLPGTNQFRPRCARVGAQMQADATKADRTTAAASVAFDPLSAVAKDAEKKKILLAADALFSSIDVNGDGAISASELKNHLKKVGYNPSSADSIFALLDVNSDNELSNEELREGFLRYDDPGLRLALGLGASEADAVFDQIDVNGDGQISEAELTEHIKRSQFAQPAETARTIFATLDTDSDGSISRDELRQGWVKYSALRHALGIGSESATDAATNAARNPKGSPKRLGRGRQKPVVELATPPPPPDDMLSESQRVRLQPVHDLKRVRKSLPIRPPPTDDSD